MLYELLFTSPILFLLIALALIISISFHEFAHAFVTDKLGDPTPRYLGRVTLDPRAHLDPIGTLLLLFIGYGWGKPVPFNPINLSNPKRDAAIIAFSGPFANFLLAGILSLIFNYIPLPELVQGFLYLTIFYNIILGVFNILPIHPLDGFKIVRGMLPQNLALQWEQIAPYGMYVLLFLVISGSLGGIMQPIINVFETIFGLPSGGF